MISFTCYQCGMKFDVKDEFAGRSTKCPTCRQALVVPEPSRTEAVVAPGPMGGSRSSLDEAGIQSVVTLPPTMTDDKHKPIGDVLRDRQENTGRYVLEGEIARGGMGAVLRAVDCDIRREVAIKYMLDEKDRSKKVRFIEEAQITGQLEHPNIVPIHELGVDAQRRVFFSMKMVRGRSLADILKQLRDGEVGEWSLGRLLNVLVNICHALAYAHSRKVIHRDLKPANIMVGDFGEVYVMDWGLAKVLSEDAASGPIVANPLAAAFQTVQPPKGGTPTPIVTSRDTRSELTQDGAILGTPTYMAPEQALGRVQAIDERSDIYSLGAILYALLTLEPPVEKTGDHLAILTRVAMGEIVPPQQRAPQRARQGLIPAELAAMAMKALAKEPSQRYRSVEAFRRDIERYQEGRSVSAKEDSRWEALVKFVKRNKAFSAATGIGSVLLLAVLAFSSVINYRARLRAESAYASFLQEQKEKSEQKKRSAPAFWRAARLLTNERQFGDALIQANAAIENEPELTDALLLKGQLLVGLERYKEAVPVLKEYAKREPDDTFTRELMALAEHPEPGKAGYYLAVGQVFTAQKVLPLAGRMAQLAEERYVGPKRGLLEVYRKQIDAAWPGHDQRLILTKEGEFHLNLQGTPVRDLTPIKGMQLTTLNLRGCQMADLEPLRGMPLTSLTLWECQQFRDLGPLQGMPLTFLDLNNVRQVADLTPLTGMPLRELRCNATSVTNLEPLQGMPLRQLSLAHCQVRSLAPLQGMKTLRNLDVNNCRMLQNVEPLRGLPLEGLSMLACFQVRDIEPLQGMPLTVLDIGSSKVSTLEPLRGMSLNRFSAVGCPITDLSPLQKMPLQNLQLSGCGKLRDLAPLADMKLRTLHLENCPQIADFAVLQGMPLFSLRLGGSVQFPDLKILAGMKLQWLDIQGLKQVRDLTPLAGMELRTIELTPRFIQKGMEVLRGMKSLEAIVLPGELRFEPAEFWMRYDKGELGKGP